ncbi:MAG: hypothetical protein IT365_05510 [Candidatus Hydrogenedentes bacterium]|nr:hypothetical protein [Candidatus Hydrogenedentota bacterium]
MFKKVLLGFAVYIGLSAVLAAAEVKEVLRQSIPLAYVSPSLQLNLEADRESARITRMGWDTDGTNRAGINLLKAPVELRLLKGADVVNAQTRVETPNAETVRYTLALPGETWIAWEIVVGADGLRMQVSSSGDVSKNADRAQLVFPFEPATAVTCIISNNWTADGTFLLPAILSAPDLGQMLLTHTGKGQLEGRIEGNRKERWVTVTMEFSIPPDGVASTLAFTPVVLPRPAGFADDRQWQAARRGWFNLIQLSCGASGGSKDVIGVWANNVLSDPVSSVLYMLVDATLLVPELAPGVSMPPILRRSVEYWIDHKTNEDGLIAYTARGTAGREAEREQEGNPGDNQNVMDSNPSVLIGAWGYVKATDDIEWLRGRIEDLEFISAYMERRDVDGDGLIESKQSGNSGSRPPRNPDCAWDCYTSGHKNAYVNTLAYRAWRGMADLEKRLGRTEQERHYQQKADQLKAAFVPAFYNPETGWLGFWRSRDGVLHDIHSDAPTSFAINYGLVEKQKGREMLGRFWSALKETGFTRFDLGTPVNVRPIPREEMEAYFDFQQFLNGGCCVSNTSYLLNALYITGMTEEANLILEAMLKRQQDGVFPNGGGFQNGFVDRMGSGAEVFDWSGNPAGYEGHLVYCWAFLHSMLLREPALREVVYEGCF